MRNGEAAVAQAGHQARQSARKASPWLVGLGRFGHAVLGVVHLLIGVLAVRVALGRGGETIDNRGALAHIATAPFGRVLLAATAIGIVGYALWRLLQAALDTDRAGTDAEGIAKRVGYAASAAIYLSLALSAVRLLQTGRAGESTSATTQGWTAQALAKPLGQWLVACGGLIVIAIGAYQLYKAYAAKFREELLLGEMSPAEERWVTWLGRIGYGARGVVFGLIGLFLIVAAIRADPGEARGIDGTLATLAAQPAGPWLLGLVAAGLAAYGLFLFAQARYRRMVVG